jgi:N-acetylmuramoyl-L-alanine amidase
MPASNTNWGRTTMRGGWPSYITIHEVGNQSPGADAEMHARFVANGGGSARVSFHAVVDDHEAIQIMPWNWVAYHAGDGSGDGNYDSIGIETCQIGDFAATTRRLAILVAKLMHEFAIPLANVKQHHFWSLKNCPEFLRSGTKGPTWAGQVAAIDVAYRALVAPPVAVESPMIRAIRALLAA